MKQGLFSSRPQSLQNVQERISLVEARHRELDARLKELGRHAYLTPSEQLEASQIKKHKLKAKDEITALRRALL
jgi:uncharacterized protein YdcH (DUF465 family)